MAYQLKNQSYPLAPEKYTKYAKPPIRVVQKKKKTKKNGFVRFVNITFKAFLLCVFCYFAVPYNYTKFTEPIIVNRFNNRHFKADMANYVSPTLNYLSNANFNKMNLRVSMSKNPQMIDIVSSGNLNGVELKIKRLMKNYPNLVPSIYIYDYQTGKTASINADKPVPVASIIKIPILFELMRQTQNENGIDINKEVIFEDKYRTLGSGDLQYSAKNQKYTLDEIAYLMITNSDNSATNMILDYIGGAEVMNRVFRNWGINGKMGELLPDMDGKNQISAHDISKILYNYDTPKFLNEKSKEQIYHYMSNLPTQKLLKAGIAPDATIIHKTGDIGKMLGDCGIVYLADGRKYIIAVLVKRNFNDYSARDFIEGVSKIAYDELSKNSTRW